MTGQNTSCIRVDNKNRPVQGIKKDGIGRFRPDPPDLEELLSQSIGIDTFKCLHIQVVIRPKETKESKQAICLHPEITDRTEQRMQNGGVGRGEAVWMHQATLLQSLNSLLDIPPARILGQNRSDDYLEGSFSWPPVLGTIGIEKRLKVIQEMVSVGGRHFGRDSNGSISSGLLPVAAKALSGLIQCPSLFIRQTIDSFT